MREILNNKPIFAALIILVISSFTRMYIIRSYKNTVGMLCEKRITAREALSRLVEFFELNKIAIKENDKSVENVKFSTQGNCIAQSKTTGSSCSYWALAITCKELIRALQYNRKQGLYILRDIAYKIILAYTYASVFLLVAYLFIKKSILLKIGVLGFVSLFAFDVIMLIFDTVCAYRINEGLVKKGIINIGETRKIQSIIFIQNIVPISVVFDSCGNIVKRTISLIVKNKENK